MTVRNPTYQRIKRRVHFLLHFRSSLSGTDNDKGPGLSSLQPAMPRQQAFSTNNAFLAIPQLFPISSSGICRGIALYPVCISMKTAEGRLLQFPATPHFPGISPAPQLLPFPDAVIHAGIGATINARTPAENWQSNALFTYRNQTYFLFHDREDQRRADCGDGLLLRIFMATTPNQHTPTIGAVCTCAQRPVGSVSRGAVVAIQLNILSVAYETGCNPFDVRRPAEDR